MKRIARRELVSAVSGLGFALALPPVMNAEAGASESDKSSSLRGAWAVNVEFVDGTVEPSLFIFNADGMLSQVNTKTRYAGFGLWKATGIYTFRYTFREQLYDPNNNLIGEVHVHAQGSLDADFDRFVADSEGTVFSTNGVVLGSNKTVSKGTRFTLDDE